MLMINTYNLMRVRMIHLLRNDMSPSRVAKINGHEKPDYILTYAQIKTSEEVLRNIR